MNKTFTVSELSRIFGISKQTLHYYDKIGIFCPQMRGENGYRLYDEAQFYKLSTIRFQQKLGKSLDQIEEYFNRIQSDPLEDLSQQLDSVHSKIKNLRRIEKMMKNKYRYTQESLSVFKEHKKNYGETGFAVNFRKKRKYLDMKTTEFSFGDEIFYSYPTMVIYDGKELDDLKDFCLFCPYEIKEEKGLPTELCYVPEGEYITGYHLGSYETIWDTFELMASYVRDKDLKIEKTVYCYNIIDLFVEPESSRYITLVEMKLK